jgi:peptide deformylase
MQDELVRELVPSTDPILKEETPNFDFLNPPMDPIELAHTLAQTCLKHNGLGLSAPQIGLPYRACIIKADPMICMFNPKIVGESLGDEYQEEGCLSFPNLIIKIKRAQVIRVRFTQPNNDVRTERYEGMTARIIQHEIDHLDGITFQQRATSYHLMQAKKKKRKLEKQ